MEVPHAPLQPARPQRGTLDLALCGELRTNDDTHSHTHLLRSYLDRTCPRTLHPHSHLSCLWPVLLWPVLSWLRTRYAGTVDACQNKLKHMLRRGHAAIHIHKRTHIHIRRSLHTHMEQTRVRYAVSTDDVVGVLTVALSGSL